MKFQIILINSLFIYFKIVRTRSKFLYKLIPILIDHVNLDAHTQISNKIKKEFASLENAFVKISILPMTAVINILKLNKIKNKKSQYNLNHGHT